MQGQHFYNKESKKVYVVQKESPFVTIKRIGDGAVYGLNKSQFDLRYSPVPTSFIPVINNYNAETPLLYNQGDKKDSDCEIGTFVPLKDCLDMDKIILNDDILESLNLAIHKVKNRDDLNTRWGLEEIPGFKMGSSINLYGAPGTGKTISAKAIAKKLEKNLLIIDYSSIISKWVGETGKNIKKIFDIAKERDAIIFMDEADSLLSKRVSVDQSGSNSINQNRNILMNQMDQFDGVMIFATNFFKNYDEAINRRIAQHVEYNLPDISSIEKIIKLHIPKRTPKKRINYGQVASMSQGLSGGDIRNVCLNAIFEASMSKEQKLTKDHLVKQIEKIKQTKKGEMARGKVGL